MIGNVKHFAKSIFRKTGFDIIKVDTFDSLLQELEVQKKSHEADNSDQNRYLEAYKKEKSIILFRPASYRYIKNNHNDDVLVFLSKTAEDFDWLEDSILTHGYYEKPNIWSYTVDADKRLLAQMIQSLQPGSTLDLGCANGPLLQALADLGIVGDGVEISSFALEHAFPGIKKRIRHGDILTLPIESSYDVISGLDIFEHLNPNKIEMYLERIAGILKPGGYVFANIPAFGKDEIFGEVFEYYLPDWENDRQGKSYFKTIHVDMHGYPVNGHLIWADTEWWVGLFERHGFQRQIEREIQLHRRFDDKLFYARRSFYLFRKT